MDATQEAQAISRCNDSELTALCQEIVEGQQREIDQMTAKLSQLP